MQFHKYIEATVADCSTQPMQRINTIIVRTLVLFVKSETPHFWIYNFNILRKSAFQAKKLEDDCCLGTRPVKIFERAKIRTSQSGIRKLSFREKNSEDVPFPRTGKFQKS